MRKIKHHKSSIIFNSRYKFTAKELDNETNYTYFGARYFDSDISIWLSVDPMAHLRSWVSPYSYCQNDPINRTDPTGALDDWVKNDVTGEYEWMDNVTSASNTPKGYSYVGHEDNDILKDLKLNYSLPEQSSNRIGYVAADAEEGKYAVSHMINVKAKSNIRLSAEVSYNLNGGTENNVLGRKFEGVNVSGTVVSSNSGADGTVSTNASLNLTYGGKNYRASFMEPQGAYYKQTGTEIGVASILIPAKNLSSSKGFTMLNVSGGWWVNNSAGFNTPVVYHPLTPYPQTFKHSWTFPTR